MNITESANQHWQQRADKVLVGSYSRYPAAIISGKGCRLKDANGKDYLDFLSGIAVCALGHCHPAVNAAISRQAEQLVHISNLYYTRPQIELAEILVAQSFADKVFFCNSGAEANEAAIKMARIHSDARRYKIISLKGSFHGRTLATVAATGQPKFHQGFEPLPEGFVHAPFGDLAALEALVDDMTCAILCEPIQGESGVLPLSKQYLQGIREICNKFKLLLIFDEVQTGMGRTGKLFAHQHTDIIPDIITLAKALANGLPIGAMMTTEDIAASMIPGTHASTFGGNPICCAAGVATLQQVLSEGFLERVINQGQYLQKCLARMTGCFPALLTGSRGKGLLIGATLTSEGIAKGPEIVDKMFSRGVLINFAGNAVLRFAPPLTVTKDEIDEMCIVLGEVLLETEKSRQNTLQ